MKADILSRSTVTGWSHQQQSLLLFLKILRKHLRREQCKVRPLLTTFRVSLTGVKYSCYPKNTLGGGQLQHDHRTDLFPFVCVPAAALTPPGLRAPLAR